MKKMFLLIILFMIPTFVYADDEVSYTVDQYQIDAYVEQDGSLLVTERFIQTGTFNGFYRDILYKDNSLPAFTGVKKDFYSSDIYNGSSLEILEVADMKLSGDYWYENQDFRLTSSATNGQYGVYIKTSLTGGYKLKMFNPSKGGSKGYYITYKVEDAVVVHNDVAELNWTFIGSKFVDNLGNVKINVYLPGIDENVRGWLHGPLNGTIQINKTDSVSSVFAVTEDVPARTPIDVRMTFDKELVYIATKKSNIDALSYILEVEEERAVEANRKRKAVDFVGSFYVFGFVAFIIGSVVYFVCVKKGPKSTFKHQYYREFPEDYGISGLEYMRMKGVSSLTVSGVLLDYIRQKKIEVEVLDQKKENYRFTLVKDFKLNSISDEIEKEILEWLFNEIGDSKEATLKEIKTWCRKNSNKGTLKFKKLKQIASKQYDENLYEKKKNNTIGTILYIGLFALHTIIYIILMSVYGIWQFSGVFFVFVPICIMVVVLLSLIKRKSQYAKDESKKIQAFRKFLSDFGKFEDKDLPHIVLWERYLVYATVLGVASKLEKTMRFKMPNVTDDTMTFVILNNNFSSGLSSSFASSIQSSISSSMSSAGGSGGGATGGGGSGGGGGGGGGF